MGLPYGLPSFIGYAPLIFWVYHLFSANVYHGSSMFFGFFGGISGFMYIYHGNAMNYHPFQKKYFDGMLQQW